MKRKLNYKKVADYLFKGKVFFGLANNNDRYDECTATTKIQIERLQALNQLLNIANYYNSKCESAGNSRTIITYRKIDDAYSTTTLVDMPRYYRRGLEAFFIKEEDAQEVIDNPNFRHILDMVYDR